MTTHVRPNGDGLDIHTFKTATDLDRWLKHHHQTSPGIWVRLFKANTARPCPSFMDLLELTLAYGWSESQRRSYDNQSFLQRITPRSTKGTTSERNRQVAERLIAQGKMTDAGRTALGLTRLRRIQLIDGEGIDWVVKHPHVIGVPRPPSYVSMARRRMRILREREIHRRLQPGSLGSGASSSGNKTPLAGASGST